MQIIRNRSGLYVVNRHGPLADHSTAFTAPPTTPPAGDLTLAVTLHDPSGFYLARTATIALPRDARPTPCSTRLTSSSIARPPRRLAPIGWRCAWR